MVRDGLACVLPGKPFPVEAKGPGVATWRCRVFNQRGNSRVMTRMSFLVLQVQAGWPPKVPHHLWGPVTFLESISLPGLSWGSPETRDREGRVCLAALPTAGWKMAPTSDEMPLDSPGGATVVTGSLPADIGSQREVTRGHSPPPTGCWTQGKGTHTPRDSRRKRSADTLTGAVGLPAPDGESK